MVTLSDFKQSNVIVLCLPGLPCVAKEFVACQVKETGVLILSEFAGAAETMHEALIINPWDQRLLTDAMHR